MERKGIKPRDHARDNVRAVKQMSQLNILNKQMPPAPPPPSRGPDVPSSGYGRGYKPRVGPNPAARPGSQDPVAEPAGSPAARLKAAANAPQQSFTKPESYGKVPRYLQERKVEMALDAEARRRAEEAEAVPEGMVLLTEDERLEMLTTLAENKKNVEEKLRRLPFNCETPSQIKYKSDLEKRIVEIEDAQRLFSRKKVMVHK